MAKPVKPPLTISLPLNYCYQRINPKRIRKYYSFTPPAANVFVRREISLHPKTKMSLFLLLQYPEQAAFAMRLVTYIGIAVSLALLLAAFILFLCLR